MLFCLLDAILWLTVALPACQVIPSQEWLPSQMSSQVVESLRASFLLGTSYWASR